MRRLAPWIVCFGIALAGCADTVAPVPAAPKALPPGFGPMPHPEDNQPTESRIQLGRLLFHDQRLSSDGSVSCASCHQADYAFADHQPVSVGVFGRRGTRNAPSLMNVGYRPHFMREGAVPTLEMQVLVPIQEHAEFDMNIVDVAVRLGADSALQQLSRAAYDRSIDPYVVTRALAAYQRTLVSSGSRYDHFVRFNDPAYLTDAERRGMSIFFDQRAACAECHAPPHFTTFGFANNGLYASTRDRGRARLTGRAEDDAVFSIPSLRNSAVTAPYMHDGSVINLKRVLQHYNDGGAGHPNQDHRIRTLGLTEQELLDLEAFLRSLTDAEFIHSPALRK